jgi:hypothetical protein
MDKFGAGLAVAVFGIFILGIALAVLTSYSSSGGQIA